MRTVLSTLLFLHGLAHLVGFLGPFEWIPDSSFQTTVFGHPVPNGSWTARALGVLWLLAALAFSVASVAVFTQTSWWLLYTTTLVLASSLLCVMAMPASTAGLGVNALLLVLVLAMNREQLWVHLVSLFRAWP